MPSRWIAACAVAILLTSTPATFGQSGDDATVRRAMLAYRDAWLANDRARVMATIAADATIYPSTLPPIAGAEAIARFWFPPDGPATRVTEMSLEIGEVHVEGNLAVVSGTGSLTFVVTSDGVAAPARTQASWHVNVLRRQPDGRWLIWRRMWGDTRR